MDLLEIIVGCFAGTIIANLVLPRGGRGREERSIPPSVVAASSGVRDTSNILDLLAEMQTDGVLTKEGFLRQKAWILSKGRISNEDTAYLRAVILTAALPKKIQSIKVIRQLCPEHGLAASKYIVDHLPQVVRSRMSDEQAESLKHQLRAAD